MTRSAPLRSPGKTAALIGQLLSGAILGSATLALGAEHLLTRSPFLSDPTGMVRETRDELMFCGVMETDGVTFFAVRDLSQHRFLGWLRLNIAEGDLVVTTYDPRSERITVQQRQHTLVLPLAKPASAIGRAATAPQDPATAKTAAASALEPPSVPAIMTLSPEERRAHVAAIIARERQSAQRRAAAEREAALASLAASPQ